MDNKEDFQKSSADSKHEFSADILMKILIRANVISKCTYALSKYVTLQKTETAKILVSEFLQFFRLSAVFLTNFFVLILKNAF